MEPVTGEGTATTSGIGDETAAGKKTKALIWEHFQQISETQTSTSATSVNAKCRYCNQTIKTNYGNTTGMHRHLENKHYAKYLLFKKAQSDSDAKKSEKKLKYASRPTTSTPAVKQTKLTYVNKWNNDHPKAKLITMEIDKWMASSLHPYNLVEEQGLKNVLKIAQPLYNLPSSKTFSRNIIPTLYKDVKNVITNSVNNQKSVLASMAITIDMWTSLSNHAFMALTANFMGEDFTINNYCLGCYGFLGEHSGECIAEKTNECLDSWGLNSMSIPIYAVTDNAKNVKLAVNLSKQLTPLSCFAHTLQLALSDAKKGTSGMSDLVAKVRKIVGHYKHSSTATERLHKIQKEMGREILNLIQDVETRWNSEYLMLSRLFTNKDPIARDLVASGKIDNLTVSEWRMVEAYVKILEPLYQATVEMCSSIMPTASMVIPILYCIEEKLKSIIEDDQGVGKMFSRQLLQCLKARFPNLWKIEPYITAMLVDPRFKDVALEPHERLLNVSELKKKIVGAKGQLLPEENKSQEKDEDKSKSLWSVFMKAAAKKSQEPTDGTMLEKKVGDELKVFFNESTIPPSEDPCAWWRQNEGRFPLLTTIVRQYLGIPATEVASERTFSSAGNVVTPLRQRLTSEHVEELVFLHQNSRMMYDL